MPVGKRGFFYQAAGLSFVASELFNAPNKWVNYIKLRANVGTQGNGAPRYALNSVYVASPDFTPAGSFPIQFPFGGVLVLLQEIKLEIQICPLKKHLLMKLV
ncbi:MAG: hypothetical protein IPQ19_02760 [Bacteroidetes bacterium]|nr:hypothetical protein [Bacteroidota bacterium]